MTNETEVSTVLVVPTTSPDEDANVLHQIFGPDFFVEEGTSLSLSSSTSTTSRTNNNNSDNNSTISRMYGESVVLVAKSLSVTIFLVVSACPVQTQTPLPAVNAVWVVVVPDSSQSILEQVEKKSRIHHHPRIRVRNEIEGFSAFELTLFSGAKIVLIPSALVSSRIGRKLLSSLLAPPSTAATTATVTNAVSAAAETAAAVVDESYDNFSESSHQLYDLEESRAVTPVVTTTTITIPNPTRQRSSSLLFPSLRLELLQQEGHFQRDFPINPRMGEGADFETDLFRGKLFMVLRPEDPTTDPYWNERLFSKRKRRVLIQIQGKFKQQPAQGAMYAGVEISEPMKLGLIARGLGSVLLRLVESFNPQVHYSYGDTKRNNSSNNNKNGEGERAHIVVPLYSFFERVVVTPPGETPPPTLGEDFYESKASIAHRKNNPKACASYQFNTTDTYSFSFHSMYMDLPTWHLIGLPVQGDISLKTFWGESLLRICMYEKRGEQKQHLAHLNRYAFVVQIKFLGKECDDDGDALFRMSGSKYVERGDLDLSHDTNNNNNNLLENNNNHNNSSSSSLLGGMKRSESQLFPVREEQQEDTTSFFPDHDVDDDDGFFDAEQYHFEEREELSQEEYQETSTSPAVGSTTTTTTPMENSPTPSSSECNAIINTAPTPTGVVSTITPRVCASVELLSRIDSACPLFIDCIKNRFSYTRKYIILVSSKNNKNNNNDNQQSHVRAVFKSVKDCEDLVEQNRKARNMVNSMFSPRMSSAERLRRMVGCTLANPLSSSTDYSGGGSGGGGGGSSIMSSSNSTTTIKLSSFLKPSKTSISLEAVFLKRASPNMSDRERASLRWSGFVARAVSDRHWIEEFATVTYRSISFSHSDKLKSNARILGRNIGQVTILSPDMGNDNCPNFPGFYFAALETLGRSVYLMFPSVAARAAFVKVIEALRSESQQEDDNTSLSTNNGNLNNSRHGSSLDIENPCDEFMHKSTMWNMKNRRLLNGGRFFFAVVAQPPSTVDPLALVSEALKNASLCANDTYQDYEHRHAFLESAALLKQAHVRHLPEDERMVFFCNLYHLMILHAFLILGPPHSRFQWISYFNNIAYETSDDIFSLAELEHCILRANMSSPSKFVTRFVLPNKNMMFRHLALAKGDWRLNFGLTCGSTSNPDRVLCYTPVNLSQQLDAATRLYLEQSVTLTTTTTQIPLQLQQLALTSPLPLSPSPGSNKSLNINNNNNNSNACSGNTKEMTVLTLPKICQWFANDFGNSLEELLQKLEPYFPVHIRQALARCKTKDGKNFDMAMITIRYHPYSFECQSFLVV